MFINSKSKLLIFPCFKNVYRDKVNLKTISQNSAIEFLTIHNDAGCTEHTCNVTNEDVTEDFGWTLKNDIVTPAYDKDDQVGSLFNMLKYQIDLANQRELERSVNDDQKINILSESFVTLFNSFHKWKEASKSEVCPTYINVYEEKLDPDKIIETLTKVIPDEQRETIGGLLEKR